jgi:branched-chain amino acid transport system substrate-binding protein
VALDPPGGKDNVCHINYTKEILHLYYEEPAYRVEGIMARGLWWKRRIAYQYSIALACLMVLFPACTKTQPVVIGFAASLSGPDYMLGVEGRNAAALFVQETNETGGLDGRPLHLEIRDIASDDTTVAAVTRELVDAGAVLVVGYYTSSAALAALSIPETGRVPLISPSATSDALSGLKDGFYRTIMSSADDGPYLARHMKERGIDRILVLATAGNAAYADTYATALGRELEICADLRFSRIADIDYQYIQVLADKPEGERYQAVMIIASSMDTGTLAQELSIRGLLAPLYVSGWAGTDDLVAFGGKAVDGAVFVHQTDQNHPGVQDFSRRYAAVYGVQPGFGAIQTWDAMTLAVNALTAAKASPDRIAAVLRGIDSLDGLTGAIFLDEYGDAKRDLYLKQVDGTRIVSRGKVE